MAKLPRLKHVKFVKAKGRVYPYFNTGQKDANGQPIRVRMPDPSSPDFFDVYAALKAGRTKRAQVAYTVADLTRDWLASTKFAGLAEQTQANYRNQSRKVTDVWGEAPVNELQPHHIRKVIEGGHWPAATCNMVLATLGTIYTWGRRNNKTNNSPVKDIERQEVGSHQPWPEDVLEAALRAEDDLVRLATHLLYFTGQRIGDVMKMRWGDIRDGFIHVHQTKTGKTVEPPLSIELRAELDRTPRKGLTILVGLNQGQVRRALQQFTLLHGVKTVPHGLRKNAVIALLEASCTVAEVAAITGQTHQVVEYYAAQVNRRKLGSAAVVKFDRARAVNRRRTGKR